jgi:hypothetical protein
MKKEIVKSWTEVPFTGVRIDNYKTAEAAFEYAEKEYYPFGYNTAYYSEDIKSLFLSRN